MRHKGNDANKHNIYTLLVTNVSTDRLGNWGIIFYRTDLLGRCHHL